MARVIFTAVIAEITGKLAGSVFQYSYGGFQLHTKGKPANPQTQYQQLRRGDFGFLAANWRNLTSLERQSFIDNAPAGQSAFNFYIECNVNLIVSEEPTIATYVPTSTPDQMDIEPVSVTETEYMIQATGAITTVPAGVNLVVFSTPLKFPTKIFTNPTEYSPIITIPPGTDLSTAVDILPEFNARFGQITADKRICLKSALIDQTNGNRGSEFVSCTNTEEMAKFIKLFADVVQAQTVGTTPLNKMSVAIPANTLVTNGDSLTIMASGISAGAGSSRFVTLRFNGNDYTHILPTTSSEWCFQAFIQRISATTANITTVNILSGVVPITMNDFDASVDWSTGITSLFELFCSTGASSLDWKSGYINKEQI